MLQRIMNRSVLRVFLACTMPMLFMLALPQQGAAQETQNGREYHNPSQVNERLQDLNRANRNSTRLHTLATSPGGRELLMIEIGPETGRNQKTMPAIFVVANMEGTVPISTEAALYLAETVIDSNVAANKSWYILPNGNPDAAAHYFNRPLVQDVRNDKPHNDDMDERTDEDGWEDLNGDGYITQMRVPDPTGEWIPVEGDPRLMKKADRSKGEKGMFSLYTEGTDNDNDGQYNEDGPGGVNVNLNFPHLYKDFTETGGAWPGSTPEVYSIFEFVFNHPEVAMTFSFGSTNFSMVPPKGGRKGSADFQSIQIPESFADQIGADPNATYTMEEVIRMVQPLAPPGFEVTESVVASFLGLGAVVNPLDDDLKFYNELADQYKEYLKGKGMEGERLDPEPAKDGSFELWSYYHLGVPIFSMDLWTLPEFKEEEEGGSGLTADMIGEMSSEEFVELGEDKLGMFLEEIGAPEQYSAEMVIKMVEGGQVTPERIAGMLNQMPEPADADGASPEDRALMAFNDNVLDGAGYVDWQTYNHPSLGDIEIGGAVPYVRNTPPVSMIDSLLSAQVPWVLILAEKIPKLSILKTEANNKGAGVWELSIWVQNENYLPFPTAMGEKNEQPRPAVLTINADGLEVLDGRARTTVGTLGGHETKKFQWLIRSPETDQISVNLESANAWNDRAQVNLGGN